MVDMWKLFRKKFGQRIRHSKVWEEISVQMCECGHDFTAAQCKSQMGDLLKRFKEIVDGGKKSGNGAQEDFEFYNKLSAILGKTAYTKPRVVMSFGSSNVVRRR